MRETIVIALNAAQDGYGDILFCLKLAKRLKEYYLSNPSEDFNDEEPYICIVAKESTKEQIELLKGDKEFEVDILTPEQIVNATISGTHEIVTVIEGPAFKENTVRNIDDLLPSSSKKIPLIIMPEYGFSRGDENDDIRGPYVSGRIFDNFYHQSTIYSGFNHKEHGVLLTNELINPDNKEWVNELDNKIRENLIGENEFSSYQNNTELFFQYSHDTYADTINPQGTFPAERFLKIHREYVKNSHKNQDVLLVGPSAEKKLNALNSIKNKLIDDKFQKITFLNTDTGKEEVLYDSGNPGKLYRGLYSKGMSHPSMVACTALSGDVMGASGDQSFGEAVSKNKIIVYETRQHKQNLIDDYRHKIINHPDSDKNIIEIVRLLKEAHADSEFEKLGNLLRNNNNKKKLHNVHSLFCKGKNSSILKNILSPQM